VVSCWFWLFSGEGRWSALLRLFDLFGYVVNFCVVSGSCEDGLLFLCLFCWVFPASCRGGLCVSAFVVVLVRLLVCSDALRTFVCLFVV
jgi:hypothetical protein